MGYYILKLFSVNNNQDIGNTEVIVKRIKNKIKIIHVIITHQ